MNRLVMKFGGTSVGDAKAILNAANIVRENLQLANEIVIVVSAMAGITDQLISCAHHAGRNDSAACQVDQARIRSRVEDVIFKLFSENNHREELLNAIEAKYSELEALCLAIERQRKVSPILSDAVTSIGERINAHIFSNLLQRMGIPSKPIEANELIVTDDHYQNATPIQPDTADQVRKKLLPILQNGVLPVITGFIGGTKDGKITTLGRGGSDYSAGIIANSLKADEIWIWTDVDGVRTTDPKISPNTRLISNISYAEIFELAYYGAKVLHPKTILPAREGGIPIRIKNTFEPNNQGTLIGPRPTSNNISLKAVTHLENVNLITISILSFAERLALGKRIEAVLYKQGINLLAAFHNKAQQTLDLAVDSKIEMHKLSGLEDKGNLKKPGSNSRPIEIRNGHALVTLIGSKIYQNPKLIPRINSILEQTGIDTSYIRYQNNQNSLSFLIPNQNCEKAIKQIHAEVILGDSAWQQ